MVIIVLVCQLGLSSTSFNLRSTSTTTPRCSSRRTWSTRQEVALRRPRWKSSVWWKKTRIPGSCTLTFICASLGGRAPGPPCFAEGHVPACLTSGERPRRHRRRGDGDVAEVGPDCVEWIDQCLRHECWDISYGGFMFSFFFSVTFDLQSAIFLCNRRVFILDYCTKAP